MDVDKVASLATAARILGPDFYAILIILVVTATAGTILMRAQKSNPRLPEEDLKPYRQFFLLSMRSAFIIVFLSIGWHIYNQHKTHVVQITILDAPQNIKVDSLYFYKTSYRYPSISSPPLTNYYFVIARETPFKRGELFNFSVYVGSEDENGGGLSNDIIIRFNGNKFYTYKLNLDANNNPTLEPFPQIASQNRLFDSVDITLAKAITSGGLK